MCLKNCSSPCPVVRSGATPCPTQSFLQNSSSAQPFWYSGATVTVNVQSDTIVFPIVGDWGRTASWATGLYGNPECTSSNFFLADDDVFGESAMWGPVGPRWLPKGAHLLFLRRLSRVLPALCKEKSCFARLMQCARTPATRAGRAPDTGVI